MNVLFLFCSIGTLDTDNALFSSLVKEFKANGHDVYVSAKGKGIKKTLLAEECGIPVLRIKSQDFTGVSNPIRKALAYQEYVIKQRYYTIKYFGHIKVDLIFSHSLPPELAWVVGGLKKHFNSPFYLMQTDFTWQDAVAYGMFRKNSPIGLYYRFWEKKIMKLADYIGCPTQGNIDFIREEYPWIDAKRFNVVRFWQKEMVVSHDNNVKTKLGLEGKFVVIYGGSVGKAQRLEHIINLADSCQTYEDIIFLIFGRGAYLPEIKEMVKKKKLQNVIFKDYIPQDQYLQLLSCCDAGIIILNEKHATPNFPSKTMSYFNLKVPVLAAIDRVTDFGKYLENNEAGLWSYAGDVQSLKRNLLSLYNSKELCLKFKENGYRVYMETMRPENAYNSIMKQIGK